MQMRGAALGSIDGQMGRRRPFAMPSSDAPDTIRSRHAHLKTLVTVALVTQERLSTILIGRANYAVMRNLTGHLVNECCVDGTRPPGLARSKNPIRPCA
jgi:hypothetical protein